MALLNPTSLMPQLGTPERAQLYEAVLRRDFASFVGKAATSLVQETSPGTGIWMRSVTRWSRFASGKLSG